MMGCSGVSVFFGIASITPTKKSYHPIVSFATAKRVADFMHQFLFRHAIAFYAGVLGLADDHDRLTAVAGFILAHKLERLTTPRHRPEVTAPCAD